MRKEVLVESVFDLLVNIELYGYDQGVFKYENIIQIIHNFI